MTDIMAEMNAFAPVIRGFEYSASATIALNSGADYLYEQNDRFAAVTFVGVASGDAALVCELTDDAGHRLYMIQNILDPSSGGDTTVTVDVDFNSEYGSVIVYDKGQAREQGLSGGRYSGTLSAGQAIFLLPY